MQQFRAQAIILRRTNYGEADRILNLLTPQHGKLSAIAKGVRLPKSKLAGGLELFAVCDVTILQGKSDMGVVTSARIKSFFGDILRDYDRTQAAYDAIKRINKATETVNDAAFYALLGDGLMYLNDLTIDWRLTALWFSLRLRELLGDGLNLATDTSDQPLSADKLYALDATVGAFYAHRKGSFDADHIKLLRLALTKNPATLKHLGGLERLDWAVLLNTLILVER